MGIFSEVEEIKMERVVYLSFDEKVALEKNGWVLLENDPFFNDDVAGYELDLEYREKIKGQSQLMSKYKGRVRYVAKGVAGLRDVHIDLL